MCKKVSDNGNAIGTCCESTICPFHCNFPNDIQQSKNKLFPFCEDTVSLCHQADQGEFSYLPSGGATPW
jgi:hypothetical protein